MLPGDSSSFSVGSTSRRVAGEIIRKHFTRSKGRVRNLQYNLNDDDDNDDYDNIMMSLYVLVITSLAILTPFPLLSCPAKARHSEL